MDDGHEFDATDVVADKAQATTKAGTLPNSVDRRIRRLQDLRVDAVQEPDPLRSNLRAATADLLEIGYRLGVGIKAVMGADPASLDRYAEAMPAIGSMALVYRQATRFIQLDRERAAGENSGR